jgi:hypothetical protein
MLAPKVLAPLLDVRLRDRRMSALRLKDLDESVWDKFAPETCLKLAESVVAQVQTCAVMGGKVGSTPIPIPRTNGRPLRIQLQQRTRNCLEDLGVLRDPSRLAGMTVGDLLRQYGFGVRCLVDLLSALEAQIPDLYRTTPEVRAAAQRLLSVRGSEFIKNDDPRFGFEVQSLNGQGENLKQVAENIVASPTCPMAPELYVLRLERLHESMRSANRLSLEEELSKLLGFEPKARNREITLAHLGWGGKAPRTLEEVGHMFGISRERVRQICQGHLDYLEDKRPYMPVLDRTLKAVANAMPRAIGRVEESLLAQHFTKDLFNLNGIMRAAAVASRACAFVLESVGEQTYAIPAQMVGAATLVGQVARKSISHWGVATMDDIAAQVSATIAREVPIQFACTVLSAQGGFRWLDQPSGWFWLESTARNALLNQIEKILSACNRIHVGELRAGVSRHHRREGFAPPQRVLLELCAQSGWCRVEGSFVAAGRSLDHAAVLSPTEAIIVSVLKENGGILSRQQLEELCLARGLKRDTYYIHLTYSPVIARYAPGVYGVRGTEIPPGLAESMVKTPKKTRVISDFGWQADGRVSVSYMLSKGALSNGIVSVPASMKSYVQGAFGLVSPDGQAVGQLVVKDTQAWGLGPFFRRRGGEPGDLFQIVFDTKQRLASVALGEPNEEPSRQPGL